MALENLRENIEMEKELVKELTTFLSQLKSLERLYPYEKREIEKRLLNKAINSIIKRLRIINNSLPHLIEAISPYKKLGHKKEEIKGLVKISYPSETKKMKGVTIEKKEKEKFLKELTISKEALRRLRKISEKKEEKIEFMEFKKANWYARLSNKLFLNISTSFFNRGELKKLNSYLRRLEFFLPKHLFFNW